MLNASSHIPFLVAAHPAFTPLSNTDLFRPLLDEIT